MTSIAGLPEVLPLEAPGSWLTRAALAQGVEVRELLAFLGIPLRADPDVVFLDRLLPSIRQACGLRAEDFEVARQLLLATQHAGVGRSNLLLKSSSGRARYRVCPQCAAHERTPYVPIHCRFSVWRFCPDHGCLLEDACWSCNAQVRLPITLIGGRTRERQIAYLSQCLECGWCHGKTPAIGRERWPEAFSIAEMALLKNGRATLAALASGRVNYGQGSRPLLRLRLVYRVGLLPIGPAAPSASIWRKRTEAEAQGAMAPADAANPATVPTLNSGSEPQRLLQANPFCHR